MHPMSLAESLIPPPSRPYELFPHGELLPPPRVGVVTPETMSLEEALLLIRERSYNEGYTDGRKDGYREALRSLHENPEFGKIGVRSRPKRIESEYCPKCDARLERDGNTCNRCGHIYVKDKDALGHGSNKRGMIGTRKADTKGSAVPKAKNPEHQTTIKKAMARLKEVGHAALANKVGRFLVAAEHKIFYVAHKTRDIATAAAKRRGLSGKRTERLQRVLFIADFVGGYMTGAAGAYVGGAVGAKVGMAMPSASLLYLTYSTVRYPVATWQGARDVVRDMLSKHSATETHKALDDGTLLPENGEGEAEGPQNEVAAKPLEQDAIADLIAEHITTDWEEAVFLAALSEGVSVEHAIGMVKKAGKKQLQEDQEENQGGDSLPGGKGDNRPDNQFDSEQLSAGVEVEKEHTSDPDKAKEIAKDHLTEDPDYYKKLRKMEQKAIARRQKRREWISAKIAIIMKDGIRGRKVSQAQAVAVAHSLWKKKRNRRRPPSEAKAVDIVWLLTGSIAVNAEELQFKETDGQADGLNEERRNEDMDRPFDPLVVPPIAVWRASADDQIYVVDGHKRLHHAKAKGIPNIRAFFIEASSFKEAKAKGERLNEQGVIVKDKDALGHGSWKKGEGPGPSIEHEEHDTHAVASKWVEAGARGLSDTQKEQYAKDMSSVLSKMTPACRKAVIERLNRKGSKVVFHTDLKVLTSTLTEISGKSYDRSVAGFVRHRKDVDEDHPAYGLAELHVDSGKPGASEELGKSVQDTPRHIYAHELGHVVDANARYSGTPEWEKVWKAEIYDGKTLLSHYARTSAIEGFAELHRALTMKGPEAVERVFPRCFKFLQSKGLV